VIYYSLKSLRGPLYHLLIEGAKDEGIWYEKGVGEEEGRLCTKIFELQVGMWIGKIIMLKEKKI